MVKELVNGARVLASTQIFFPKPKGFGCIVAAVLLILSPKEMI